MISALIGVLGLFGLLAWGLAAFSAIQIVRLTPMGQRLRTYGQLGWWQFDAIRATVGPRADAHIRTYRRAFVAFIVCVLASIAVGGLLSVTAQN